MNTQHTPGPWACMGLNARWGIYPASAINDGVDYFIATTRSIGDKSKEKANACLMAAAPELRDALQRVWDAYGFDPSIDSSIWTDVQAALAKATPPARAALAAPGAKEG